MSANEVKTTAADVRTYVKGGRITYRNRFQQTMTGVVTWAGMCSTRDGMKWLTSVQRSDGWPSPELIDLADYVVLDYTPPS